MLYYQNQFKKLSITFKYDKNPIKQYPSLILPISYFLSNNLLYFASDEAVYACLFEHMYPENKTDILHLLFYEVNLFD